MTSLEYAPREMMETACLGGDFHVRIHFEFFAEVIRDAEIARLGLLLVGLSPRLNTRAVSRWANYPAGETQPSALISVGGMRWTGTELREIEACHLSRGEQLQRSATGQPAR